jgi:hypothetical protein
MQSEYERSRSAKRAKLITQLSTLGHVPLKKRCRPKGVKSGNGEVGLNGTRRTSRGLALATWLIGSRASKMLVKKSRSTSLPNEKTATKIVAVSAECGQ